MNLRYERQMASICSIHSHRQPAYHDGSALSPAQRESTDDQWPEDDAYELVWRFERESARMDPSDSAQPSEQTSGSNAAPLVLIVDDEAPIAEALTLIVEEAGYSTLTAFRGPAGLALAREHHPALIFTDMMMPQLDGASLIKTLRRDAETDGHPAPLIVAMTAGGLHFARKASVDAILPKPFAIDDVEAILSRLLPLDGQAH